MNIETIKQRLEAIAYDLHAKSIYADRILYNSVPAYICSKCSRKRAYEIARLRAIVARHSISYTRREQRIVWNIYERPLEQCPWYDPKNYIK